MEQFDLYKDIAERTQGEIYLGVVGPVRTGKSTFIKRFMDLMVIPQVDNPFKRDRINDELPQSGAGRGIMTMQPNFVPNEAVEIKLDQDTEAQVRLIDCVGYLVDGATGQEDENGEPRMVRTPWYDYDIPFSEAAEIGTRRVIAEHSTVGIIVTTDGSISDIPRTSYVQSEERVVNELKQSGKPFVVVLNSKNPQDTDSISLRDALKRKYDVPVMLINVQEMALSDLEALLTGVLHEFPLREVFLSLPDWVMALSNDHWILDSLCEKLRESSVDVYQLRDYKRVEDSLRGCDFLQKIQTESVSLGHGAVQMNAEPQSNLFYRILGDECGTEIESDYHLVTMIKELVSAKKEYDKVAQALVSVRENGYGVVSPSMDELMLEEPEIVRQGGRYGVRLKASAPSLHIIRVDIETEVSPIVGSEKQSEELLQYLLSEFENDPTQIWSTNIFGKSLHGLVKEGLSNKLNHMPAEAQAKIQMTLQRIINEGRNNLLCILF